MSDALLHKLADLFALATAHVPFYQEIYRGITEVRSFADFAGLPIVTRSMLASSNLHALLASQQSLCISRTYEDDPEAENYVPKLLSHEDVVDDHDLLSFLMKPILTEDNRQQKIMLICDERHIYATAELGNQLAFYEWPLTVGIGRNQSLYQLSQQVNWFRPTIVFLDGPRTLLQTLHEDIRYLFTFNQPDRGEPGLGFGQALVEFDILRDTLVGPMALRHKEDEYYSFDPESFYFETSDDGTLLVTSLNNRLQPLIRYELDRCKLFPGTNTSDHKIYTR